MSAQETELRWEVTDRNEGVWLSKPVPEGSTREQQELMISELMQRSTHIVLELDTDAGIVWLDRPVLSLRVVEKRKGLVFDELPL